MTVEHYDPKFIESNPWQTRSREPNTEYIQELAADIKKNGLLQVPIGRLVMIGAAKVQLAFGHNRLKAYLQLGLPLMPVDVRELTDEQMAAFAWSENEKRRDVTAIERAKAIQQRITDFKWTNRQAADALGVDHSTISNLLRLLKLPEELQTANLEGKLSERQIQAILPLFETPEEIKKLIGSNSYYYNQPTRIIQEALQGNSSDYLRKQVEGYFDGASQNLAKAEFKLDEMFREGGKIYCGLCKTCDRRMVSRNKCFDRICFDAKTEAVRRLSLASASIKSGYDLVDETKGGQTTSLPNNRWENEKRERILATKCPNLRLQYTTLESDDIEGYPHARLVCDKRNNSCTCIKGIEILKQQDKLSTITPVIGETGQKMVEVDPSEELSSDEGETVVEIEQEPVINNLELEEAVRQQRKAKAELDKRRIEIERKLAAHLLKAIMTLEPGALYIAIHRNRYPSKGNLNLDRIFGYLANEGARMIMPAGADNIEQLVKFINQDLKKLELEPFSLEERKIVPMTEEDEKFVDSIPVL